MRRPFLVTAIFATAVIWGSYAILAVPSPDRGARTLFQALRAHEQLYQQALSAETDALAATEGWLASHLRDPGSGQEVRARFLEVEREFAKLSRDLRALKVQPELARQFLLPILRQLETEEQEMREIEDLIARIPEDGLQQGEPESLEDLLFTVKAKVEQHEHPANLFTPAIKGIRQQYGVARQRYWRGRPLTA